LAVQDSFSELADAFNALVGWVAGAVDERGLGKALLFVIDGTDRLRRDEAETFFIHDIHQLRLVRANFVYCAPITILTEAGQGRPELRCHLQAPGQGRGRARREGQGMPAGVSAQAPAPWLFRLGPDRRPPGSLLRRPSARPAPARKLLPAGDQRRADHRARSQDRRAPAVRRLPPSGGAQGLRTTGPRIDAADKSETPIDEQSRRLLYDLVLLEYDDFWWQSHPAVRDLPGYATAAAKIEPASPAGGLRGPDAPG